MPKPYIPVFTPRTSAERARLKNWLSLVDGLFDENGQIQPTAFANLSVPSASLVDQGILTHSGSGTAKTLNAATTVVDGTYFTTGRPNKLRLVATDINATAVLYNDGSGNLNQNAATIGIKIAAAKTIVIGSNTLYDASGHLTLAAGSKITVGSQGIIDASGNFAIASGKTITVGSQAIVDSSANIALASGKTIKVGTTTVVNSSGQVPATVVLGVDEIPCWSYFDFQATAGDAAEIEASRVMTALNEIHTVWYGALYKLTTDLKLRLRCMIRTGTATTTGIKAYLVFVGGGGSFQAASSQVVSSTATEVTVDIDVSSGAAKATELVPFYIQIELSLGSAATIYIKRPTVLRVVRV